MKRIVLLGLILSALPLVTPLFSDTKAPETPSTATIEVRANAAFDKGDYATALPLLMIVAKQSQDQKDKLGPIQERIRVCQTNLTKNAPADTATADKTKTSPEQRKPHVRPKDGEAFVIGAKELGNFEYDAEKGGNLPSDVVKLTGVKIRTHGFMIPLDQADNITEFALVPSLFACCFGQPPQVQHTLVVHAPKGKAVSYFPDEIVVEGTLKVQEKKEDGLVVSVFEIDCQSVKPAAK